MKSTGGLSQQTFFSVEEDVPVVVLLVESDYRRLRDLQVLNCDMLSFAVPGIRDPFGKARRGAIVGGDGTTVCTVGSLPVRKRRRFPFQLDNLLLLLFFQIYWVVELLCPGCGGLIDFGGGSHQKRPKWKTRRAKGRGKREVPRSGEGD